ITSGLSMLSLFLLSSLLLSPVSAGRTYPDKCQTCNEMVSYIIQEFPIAAPVLTKDIMQAIEVYCFHHVGGTEAMCSDFSNMLRKGNLFDILWRSTQPCRDAMSNIKSGSTTKNLLWGCPTSPDCVCLNLEQCESHKQETVFRSKHAECSDLDIPALEEFTEVFKKIKYTAYDSQIL
ncbi:hypothetical protein PENTCL1PPCAC_25984, partial [Pristionchus entomophagus]